MLPAQGGAIASLRHAGGNVLRPTAAGMSDMFDFACFPLVPYANRIAYGRLAWEGRTYHLAPNHPAQAHPLHGLGWLAPWTVAACDGAGVTMKLRHAEDAAWPWRFSAVQKLALSASGFQAKLTLRNDGNRAMPCSLGFHPYFVKAPGDRLTFSAGGVWLVDAEMLPTVRAEPDALGDWAGGASLTRDDVIDNCYIGWSGQASITRKHGEIAMEGGHTPNLQLYVPPHEDFFCLEPVTAIPDALNRPPVSTLAPGESTTIEMRIANR